MRVKFTSRPWKVDERMPRNIDEYIAERSPEVQTILERIPIRKAAPDAEETISYQIPTFTLRGTLIHFGAFQQHIGFYPPVTGDAELKKATSAYAGVKGNLKFPLDRPIPYGLIGRIVKLRVKQNREKTSAKDRRGDHLESA